MGGPTPTWIDLDASKWRTVQDFYDAVLAAIEAPAWHGRSPDALNDSMVFGGINGLMPPYDLVIRNLNSPEIARSVDQVRQILAIGRAEFRAQHGRQVEVSIRLEGQSPVRDADQGANDNTPAHPDQA